MGAHCHQASIATDSLLQQVLDRDNLIRALNQVNRNRGAAGVDSMSVEDLPSHLKHHWPQIKAQRLDGRYRPQPALRVAIPKADGRQRKLGIPTVTDRLIQQAIAQVLTPIWEPLFHPNSYGFRPKRSAHQAVRHAQSVINSGKRWVVDIDFDSFFDRVNHDRLMHKLKEQITDQTLLRLINRYLKSGTEVNGMFEHSVKGVPQGSPLSPLLSNIVLNELDWELDRRGHHVVRYADDCQIYVNSQRAGERVKQSLTAFAEDTLRLKVNVAKSAVDRPWKRTFLGFTFSSRRGYKLKVSDKALNQLKHTVRATCRRTRGHSIHQVIADLRETLLGWKAYFGIAQVKSPQRDLDKWIRRKLRCYLWKQWGRSGYRKLRALGQCH